MSPMVTRSLAILLAFIFAMQSLLLFPISALAVSKRTMVDSIKYEEVYSLPISGTKSSLPLNLHSGYDAGVSVSDNTDNLSTQDDQAISLGKDQEYINFGDQPILIFGDNNTISINQDLTPGKTPMKFEGEKSEEDAPQGTQEESNQPSTSNGERASAITSAKAQPTLKSRSGRCHSSNYLDCELYSQGYIRVHGDKLRADAFNDAMRAAMARGDNTVIDVRNVEEFEIESSLDPIRGDFDHYIWVVGDPNNSTKIKAKYKDRTQLLAVDLTGGGFLAFFGIEFEDGYARGGDAEGGAGGGLGAGGALFLNKGNVIVDRTFFTANKAQKGNSAGLAGSGGDGTSNASTGNLGEPGSPGGKFNISGNFDIFYGNDSGGDGGSPGELCRKKACSADRSQNGHDGKFGVGGGSAGGGGSDAKNTPDAGRDGGMGGEGGFGAGGGGGGGGGGDDEREIDKPMEPGSGGSGGKGGPYGENGLDGSRGERYGHDGGDGGYGGGGAALGGAIFVRETEGANLQLSSSSFHNNRVTSVGSGIFALKDESDESQNYDSGNVQNYDYYTSDTYTSDGLPTLSLSLVNLNGEDLSDPELENEKKQYKIFEGERVNLKVSVEGQGQSLGAVQSVYFYLSPTKTLAKYGNSEESEDINDQTNADFAWNGNIYYEFEVPEGASSEFFLSIPYPDRNWTNGLDIHSGIQTYIDKLLEGDEDFTIDILPGEGYKLTENDSIDQTPGYSQRVIIEDTNYQVELLDDRNTEIADVADALAPKGDPATLAPKGDSATDDDKIDLTNLLGLGYVTVQAKRPVNVSHGIEEDELLPSNSWSSTSGQYDSTVNGDFFNNALAGGLPIHYTLTSTDGGERGEDYWSNQVNYNNEKYGDQQIYDAVVIPVTDEDKKSDSDGLPPGQARIYFAALPDAVKEEPEHYKLTILPFDDPSYEADLQNTPEGNYQFYRVRSDKNDADIILIDSQEFTPGIIVADNVNGEVVSEDNPLVLDTQGKVQFWVKLGSQPASDEVEVTVTGNTNPGVLTFTPDNWYSYKKVTYTGSGETIDLSIESGDPLYTFTKALPLDNKYDHLKVTESSIPDVSQRTVALGVVASVKTTTEGKLDDPKFIISLGQPLPSDLEINYQVNPPNEALPGTITIPKYQQRVTLPYPIEDDNIVEVEQEVTLKLSDDLPENVSLEKDGTAAFTLKDNDHARVLIKKHLPARPTEKDVPLFVEEFYIDRNQRNSPNPSVVHSFTPGVKEFVIVPEDVEWDDPSDQLHNYGLLREVADIDQKDDRQITFPEYADKANIETFNTGSLSLSDLPSGRVTRLRGQLEVPNEGDYTFGISGDILGQAELWINGVQMAKVPETDPPESQHLEAGINDIVLLYRPIPDPSKTSSREATSASIAQIKVTPANPEHVLQLSEIEAYGDTWGYPGSGCTDPKECDLALSEFGAVAEASSVYIEHSEYKQTIINSVIDGKGPKFWPNAYVSALDDTEPYLLVTLAAPEPLTQLTILEETSPQLDYNNIYNVELRDESGDIVFEDFNLSAVGDGVNSVTITDFSQSGSSPLVISWDDGTGDSPIPAYALRFPAVDSGFSVDPYVPPSNYVKQLKITSADHESDKTLKISEVVANDREGQDVASVESAQVILTGNYEPDKCPIYAIDGNDDSFCLSEDEDAELIIILNQPTLLTSVIIKGTVQDSEKDIYNLELLNDQGQVISSILNLDANNEYNDVSAFNKERSVKKIRILPGFDPKLIIDKHLTIAEVEAMDRNDNNLALRSSGAIAKASSFMPGSLPRNAIDGEYDSEANYQSRPKTTDEYLLINLAYPSDIANVKIHAPADIEDENKDYIVQLLNKDDFVLATFPINTFDEQNEGMVQINKLVAKLRVTPTNANVLQISEVKAYGTLNDQQDLADIDLNAAAEGSQEKGAALALNVIDGDGPSRAEQQNYISSDQTGGAELIVTLPYLDELSKVILMGRASQDSEEFNIYDLELINAWGEVIERCGEIEANHNNQYTNIVDSSECLASQRDMVLASKRDMVDDGVVRNSDIRDEVNEVSFLPAALDFASDTPITKTTRFQAIITPPESGEYTFALESNSGSRLFVEKLNNSDNNEVLNNSDNKIFNKIFNPAPRSKPIAYIDEDERQNNFPDRYQRQWLSSTNTRSQNRSRPEGAIPLQKGEQYLLSVQLDPPAHEFSSQLSVKWAPPSGSGLELLKTINSKARPVTENVLLPLKLSTSQSDGDDDLIQGSIEITDPSITFGDARYKIASLTLEGDPAYEYPDYATPHIPSTFIPFASGFMGHLAEEVTITPNQPTSIKLKPIDSSINAETLYLTEGEKQRISFQLEAAPGENTTVTVNLVEQDLGNDIKTPPNIELYCPDEESGNSEDECKVLSFDANNWNQPQYMIVKGLQAAKDDHGNFDPASSQIRLIAIAEPTTPLSAKAEGDSAKEKDFTNFVTVKLFPKKLDDFAVYYVNTNDEALDGVGFVDPVENGPPTIIYTDAEGATRNFTDWTWAKQEDDLVAMQGENEVLRLIAHEETLNQQTGAPDKLQLTAKAVVSPDLFDSPDPWAGTIAISDVKLKVEGMETASTASVDVTLSSGNPSIEIHNYDDSSGEMPFGNVQKISYTSTTGYSIEIEADEPMITEYGIFKFDRHGNWFYEANSRPQPELLTFTATSELGNTKDILLNSELDQYNEGVHLITNLFALPDDNQPLAKATIAKSSISETDTNGIDVVITLDKPVEDEDDEDEDDEDEDDRDIYVHYTLNNAGHPFDKALDLGVLNENSSKFALEIADSGDDKLIVHPWNFTAEFWLSYTDEKNEGLLTAVDESQRESTLMQIDHGKLNIGNITDLEVELSDYNINKGQAFHVAYRSSDEGQAVFINGRKRARTEQRLSRDFNSLKAIGRDSFGQYFTGVIGDVRLWTKPRSDEEIGENYRESNIEQEDGLVGSWAFEENLTNELDGVALELINSTGQPPSQELEERAWRSRTLAEECVDYTLSDSVCNQKNFFGLDAGNLEGKTTFAIADFNDDHHPDAVIVDGNGNVNLYQNTGLNPDFRQTFNLQPLNMNLGEANPITAGDIDNDGDIDLVFGTTRGEVKIIENNGSKLSAHFQTPRIVRTGGKALKLIGSVAPTLADLDGDGVSELITLDSTGQMREFKSKLSQGELNFPDFLPMNKPLLPKMLRGNDSGYFAQFVDLDLDGDLDILVDKMWNLPGQHGGGHRYYVNYGTSESPYFVEAPHSAVAVSLRGLDTEVTYGNRTFKTPYDQVQFYNYVDWNGDGILERFQSDNKGEIHLRSTNYHDHQVMISKDDKTGQVKITPIRDQSSEGLEYVELQLVQADFNDPYHVEPGMDRVTVEITNFPNSQGRSRSTQSDLSIIESDDEDHSFTVRDIGNLALLDYTGYPIDWTNTIDVSETADQSTVYNVKLSTEPNSDVQLTITSSQPSQGLVAKEGASDLQPGLFKNSVTLYFSPENWDSAQPFWVQGVDDQVDDENAAYGYVFNTRSSSPRYSNVFKVLQARSTNNDEEAGLDLTFDTLPEAALAEGALLATEGAINIVKVALSSKPTQPVTVTLDPEDREITFYPQRRIVAGVEMDPMSRQVRKIPVLRAGEENSCDLGDELKDGTPSRGKYGDLCWRANGDFVYTQIQGATATEEPVDEFSFSIDNGYGLLGGDSISIPVASEDTDEDTGFSQETPLVTRRGNLFFNAKELAGQPMILTFTPSDWNLERTVAVSAVDDDIVEYHHDSYINVLLSDPNQALDGNYGTLKWTKEGVLTYDLASAQQLDPGEYLEERIYFTESNDESQNHTLDIKVTAIPGSNPNENTSYAVSAIVDQDTNSPRDFNEGTPEVFSLNLGRNITGMAKQLLDPTYLATGGNLLRVSIQDNDRPIVRAGVDLNAMENTTPGYFSLSVLEAVGIPGGLPVHYAVYGSEDGEEYHATAERKTQGEDPGPDFQGFDQINRGTLYIPEGKTRVVFPIFPIDDFTPEESLAARYEKVVVEVEPPMEDDLYLLDALYPETQTAAVRILDNEKVGLKVVIPADGLNIDEGGFKGFRVGLKSQPQKPVDLNFYYNDIRSDNQQDLTFLDIDSVKFDNTNWNQWQTVDVRLFNNLSENLDDLHPRYTDLYYTLGAGTDEPFYNTLKGALNSTGNSQDAEATVIEGRVIRVNGENVSEVNNVEGTYGTLTLTNVANQYLGDFTYTLDGGKTHNILKDIDESGMGKVFDEFSYAIQDNNNVEVEQRVAVEIRALNDTNLTEDENANDLWVLEGHYGILTLHDDGSYQYVLKEDNLPNSENWSIHDSFVYILETPEANSGEASIQLPYALNLVVTQDQDTGRVNRYAQGNGDSVNICHGDQTKDTREYPTVCDGIIDGNVIAAEIDNSAEYGPIPQSRIIKAGKTDLVPVVTAMTLRNKEGVDLEVNGAPLYTNPLFMAMPLNRTEDFVPGTPLKGKHGTLTLHDDGSYSYEIDMDTLTQGLEDYEERIVHDRFVYTLSNRNEKVLQLVTTYDVETGTTTVRADDRSTLTADDVNPITFIGTVISQPQEPGGLEVRKFGLATTSVHPQEQSLDPIVVRDGIAQMLSTLQGNFNNISVPIVGRLGGGRTGDYSGSGSEAPIPDFTDRLLSIVESGITKQPHLTTTELEKVFKEALQETFGSFGVPIIVLKFDTEKLLLELSYGYGATITQAEAASDWGDPGLGRFKASGSFGYKTAIDVVFGIKFRTYQSSHSGQGSKLAPSVFIVTSKEKLDSLMSEGGDSKPATLFPLRTWAGQSVPPNGVVFGDTLNSVNKPKAPDNAASFMPGGDLVLDWEWKSVSKSNGIELNSKFPFVKFHQPHSYAQIVGTVAKEVNTKNKANFIEISLVQPAGIGANSSTTLTIKAIADPDHLLQSINDLSLSEKANNVNKALEWFAQNDKTINFNNREILVTSLSSKDTATRKTSFQVSVKKKMDSSPLSISREIYDASVNVKSLPTTPPEIPKNEEIILPFSSKYESQHKLTLPCSFEREETCKPKQIFFTEKVPNDRSHHSQEFIFPLKSDITRAFGRGRKSFKDKKDLAYGTIEAMATLKGTQVTYTWSYSPKAKDKLLDQLEIVNGECQPREFKQQKCRDNRGYKKIDLEVKEEDKSQPDTTHFQLMDGTLAFSVPETVKKDSPEYQAVSKVSAELIAISDFVGGITMGVFSASINQALREPIAPVNSKLDKRDPADAYKELAAKYSDRKKIVEISEENADQNSQAFIVGKFGVLGLAKDGSYSYALKPEARIENFDLVYKKASPTTHDEAAAQALFKEFLGDDLEQPSNEAWEGVPEGNKTIEFNGYTIDCPAFQSVLNGTSCQVSSPHIIMSTTNKDELQGLGVPSLEAAIDAEDLPAWDLSSNLTNRTTLYELKQKVESGQDPSSISDITELQDKFFIASNQEPGYDELVITYGKDDSLWSQFETEANTTLQKEGDVWHGTNIYSTVNGQTSPVPVEASPGKIKPMAKARIFLNLAITSQAKNGSNPGILAISLKEKNIKDFKPQFTLEGEAALYAQVNMGFGFSPKATETEQDAELGYDIPLPKISANLGLTAHYDYTSNSPTHSASGGEILFGIYDLGLDLGSLISENLAGPLGNFSNFVEPVQPIINALNSDTKIFNELGLVNSFDRNEDGIVTILEIPTPFLRVGNNKYGRMLNNMDKVLNLLADTLQMYQVAVDLGHELSGVKALKEQVVSGDGYMVAPEDIRINPLQPGTGSNYVNTMSQDFVPYVDNFGHIIVGSKLNYQYSKSPASPVSDASVKKVDTQRPEFATNQSTNNSAAKKVKKRLQNIQNLGFVSFPILKNPMDLLQLLFGYPAELITLDLPKMEMDFRIDLTFPIYGLLKGTFDAGLEVRMETQMGVDTQGLQTLLCGDSPVAIWNCSDPDSEHNISEPENLLRLANMIYLRDWSEASYEAGGDSLPQDLLWTGVIRSLNDKQVVDKYELSGDASTHLGVAVKVAGLGPTMEGGIGIGGGFDIVDLWEQGSQESGVPATSSVERSYDGKIRAYDFFGTQVGNQLDEIFSMLFELYAELNIGIDIFKTEVFSLNLARFKLFEFSFEGASFIPTGLSPSGNPLVGSVAFFDANGNQLPDAGEPMTFTDSQGQAPLHVPYKFFDKNGDQIIDDRDGRIVMLDGVDVKNNLPQLEPLVAVPQAKIISPITTRVSALVDQGLSVEEAQAQVTKYKRSRQH